MTTIMRGVLTMALSLAIAPLVLTLLRRGRVFDHPTERSSHVTPVPRGGGIAVALAALVGLAATPSAKGTDRWAIALAAAVFGLVGLLEDVIGIRALHRLGIQFIVAAFVGSIVLDDLTGTVLWRGIFAVGVVFWLVAFVNAYNFMDGINGISVAQAVVAGVAWLLIGVHTDSAALAVGGAIVAGAALGFAPYNVPRARMFLGDVGSYFIGAWLAAVAVLGLRAGVPPEAVLAPLALYVADTGATLARRVMRGERWYLPHRDHTYQRLTDCGWSHVRTAGFVTACIGLCGALGAVSLSHSVLLRLAADIAIAAVVVGYLFAPTRFASSGSTMATP